MSAISEDVHSSKGGGGRSPFMVIALCLVSNVECQEVVVSCRVPGAAEESSSLCRKNQQCHRLITRKFGYRKRSLALRDNKYTCTVGSPNPKTYNGDCLDGVCPTLARIYREDYCPFR